jgi:hypothetical protein
VPRSRKIVLAAGVVWAALAGGLALRLSGTAVDDFFITYRYAWNLLHGEGFVFNPGERVFGVTDPGFALLLAAAGYLSRITIPTLGTFLTGLAMLGIALALLGEAIERARLPEALAAGTLTILSSCLWVNQGAGVFWALLLLLLAARLGARWPVAAGALAGLALWMRPDAGLGAALLAVLLWAEAKRLPWRFAFAAAAVALAGAAAAGAYFGSVFPATLAAKQGLASASDQTWAGLERFWARLVPILPRHWGAAWPWIALCGGLGHAAVWLRLGRAGRCLAGYSLALAVAYPLLDVPFSFWYVVPTVIGALYGIVFLAGEAGRAVGTWTGRRLGRRSEGPPGAEGTAPRWVAPVALGASALLLAPLLASLLPANLSWLRKHDWQPHLKTYRAAALWLRDHSEEGDSIAYVEIGVWGFYSRRTVVDLLGLVTPSSVPYARVGDRVGAFLERPTDWVVFHSRGGMAPLLERAWFPRAYEERVRFDEGGGRELVLYRQTSRIKVPPPRPPRPGGSGAGRLKAAPPPSVRSEGPEEP